jgi:hypothetical protein
MMERNKYGLMTDNRQEENTYDQPEKNYLATSTTSSAPSKTSEGVPKVSGTG